MKKLLPIVIVILFGPLDVTAYTFSGIDIVNVVGEYPSNHYDAVHMDSPLVSDGLDVIDQLLEDDFCDDAWLGGGFVYSEVEGQKCLYDCRPCDSVTPFQLQLFFCGIIDETENCLHVDFYVDESRDMFDDKQVILESYRLLYGFAVDVRRVIEIGSPYGVGVIQLENVPAGSHDITSPYGSATLHIGTRSLGDLNRDGICNFADFSYMADDWLAPQGKHLGDISGENGMPDGFVDLYDVRELALRWLDVTV
ncbi:hypothetical protein ES703_14658 [subsurface metagenome]